MAAISYPVVIHKDASSDYGVTVPDLPGCFSAGRTLDEALRMGKEAIELHLEGLLEEGLAVPAPGSIETYRKRRDFKGGTWALVTIDRTRVLGTTRRINIMMPDRVLAAVDKFAEKEGESRSSLLVQAVTRYMNARRTAAAEGEGRGRREDRQSSRDSVI